MVGGCSPAKREIGDDLMLSHNLVIVADCMQAIKVESGKSNPELLKTLRNAICIHISKQ